MPRSETSHPPAVWGLNHNTDCCKQPCPTSLGTKEHLLATHCRFPHHGLLHVVNVILVLVEASLTLQVQRLLLQTT